MNLNEFMLRKKNYKRMFAVLATTLVLCSFFNITCQYGKECRKIYV